MKTSAIIFILLGQFCFLSCKMKKHSDSKNNGDSIRHEVKEQYPQATIGEFKSGNSPYSIKSVALRNKILEIEVSYGGGCAEHQFELIAKKELSTTNPATREIQLFHAANDDKCKKLIQEKQAFAISNLLVKGEEKVILKLENYEHTITLTNE